MMACFVKDGMVFVLTLYLQYTKCLRYDGKITTYYTEDIKKFDVVHHINLYEAIYNVNYREKFEDE